ncbi:hypothetical protein DSM3645_28392 [Blastopirellula marina DSM 3645]|uniref:Uncharacterized protein n=1 Tax=Blastopirellula marina DSM 3645 TaxID=314230 RepID=A3ZPA0_9BACT|nr:hypothetical protein DSM3645_28392 [Blastopirellula marina DSM 3645]
MLNNSRQDKRLAAIKQSRNRQDALAGLSQVAHHGAIAVEREPVASLQSL